jgi:hypothetical protein
VIKLTPVRYLCASDDAESSFDPHMHPSYTHDVRRSRVVPSRVVDLERAPKDPSCRQSVNRFSPPPNGKVGIPGAATWLISASTIFYVTLVQAVRQLR